MAYNPVTDIVKKAKGGADTLKEVGQSHLNDLKSGAEFNPMTRLGASVQDLKTLNSNTILPEVGQFRKDVGKTPLDWSNKAEGWWTQKVRDPVVGFEHSVEKGAGRLGNKIGDWINGRGLPGSDFSGNIPTVGVSGGIGGTGQPTGPVQIGNEGYGLGARGALVGNPNQFRDYQSNLASQLARQALGQGPSVAQMQFQQAQQQNQAALFSQLASSRGNPLAARTAAMQNQQLQSQTARDSAIARLTEQQKAQEALGNVSNQGRTGDITETKINQDRQIEQAKLGAQYQELQAKYAALGLDAQKANQLAALDMEKIKRGLTQDQDARTGNLFNALGSTVGAAAKIFA